jgi:nucleotide-binding universal stress UspA family protein
MIKDNDFNRILVSVDGSDSSIKAAKKAISMSKELEKDVISVYVVDITPISGLLSTGKTFDEWERELEEDAQKTLNKIQKIGQENKTSVKTMMLKGDPAEEIIKEANKNDLIVMGSKGKSALDRILIGSVSEKVLHHSDATVMIVR